MRFVCHCLYYDLLHTHNLLRVRYLCDDERINLVFTQFIFEMKNFEGRIMNNISSALFEFANAKILHILRSMKICKPEIGHDCVGKSMHKDTKGTVY